jgi:aminopeptidase N
MTDQRFPCVAFFSIVLVLSYSAAAFAGNSAAKEMLYQAEFQNWLEYIERYQDFTPDTSTDAKFYYIDVDIALDSPFIQGNVLCEFDILEPNLQQIALNLRQSLTIDSITGDVSGYTFDNDTIYVDLDRPYNPGESIRTTVYYHGVPELAGGYKGLRYETHAGGEPIIATLSTPYLSHYWWPCKDGPGDKPDSVYIDIAIPDTVIGGYPLIATSNGVLEQVVEEDGKRIFQWRERYPIVPYYVMAAISNYREYQQIYSGDYGETFPIDYYIFDEDYSSAVAGVERLPEVINLFSILFGKYPFDTEKYGMSQLGYYGAIENQTNTIQNNMSPDWFDTSVHELAHMWFGDMITCRDWHHGWLNEGFATYAEALWAEEVGGTAAYRNNMAGNEYYDGGTVYLQDVSNPYSGVFVAIIYYKGAYVLHMLRGILGDTDFFETIYVYSQRPAFRYDHAVTEKFQAVCEQVADIDLDFFFDQWIYDEYYPRYEYGYYQNPVTYETSVSIEQVQVDYGWRSIFEMPVQLKFQFETAGDTVITVWNDQILQEFQFDFTDVLTRVVLDPDDWILKRTQVVDVGDTPPSGSDLPKSYSLSQNYPNPFNPSTTIAFNLPGTPGERQHVDLTIYDIRGRRVKTLVDSDLEPGSHKIYWNGRDSKGEPVSSGIYMYTFKAGNKTLTRKMTVLK